MKKAFIILACGVLIAGGIYIRLSKPAVVSQASSYNTKKVVLGGTEYTLEVAYTEALRERGLSYRTTLAPQTGMIFVFDTPGVLKFWMKDMNFPIDIIWLDARGEVVHIEHSLSPSTYPESFGPETMTRYVIEINAGEASSLGLKEGDYIAL